MSTSTTAPAMPSAKEQWLQIFRHERAITLKLMKAFPPDRGDFQPHPRSQSARRLMWTFVTELKLGSDAMVGPIKLPPDHGEQPATVEATIAAYERAVREADAAVSQAPESRLFETMPFFTGPGQMGEIRVLDFIWLMLMDSIHHRGQLSVYIRMAGGKVPSIYGPSADEPWM